MEFYSTTSVSVISAVTGRAQCSICCSCCREMPREGFRHDFSSMRVQTSVQAVEIEARHVASGQHGLAVKQHFFAVWQNSLFVKPNFFVA